MASIGSLQLLRHLARRAHQDAVKTGSPDAELFATAHEEICELLGKTDLLFLLCKLGQDHPGDGAQMRNLNIVGAAIGLPHPVVLDFKAAESAGVQPKSASNLCTV